MEAFSRKPDAVVDLLKRAIQAGFAADFVLMDSWLTQAPLLRSLISQGLQVIGMVKDMKQYYLVGDALLTVVHVSMFHRIIWATRFAPYPGR